MRKTKQNKNRTTIVIDACKTNQLARRVTVQHYPFLSMLCSHLANMWTRGAITCDSLLPSRSTSRKQENRRLAQASRNTLKASSTITSKHLQL